MKISHILLGPLVMVVGAVPAGAQSQSLAGYADGAQVVRVETERPQVDEGGGVIYSQIKKPRSMRMTLLVPHTPNLKPAIVYFPGGGFTTAEYLRAHAANDGIDPVRIGVLGDSAGAWVAQLLGTSNGEKTYDEGDLLDRSSDVRAVVSLYCISDVRNIGEGFPPSVRAVHRSPAFTEALLVKGPAFLDFAGAPVDSDPATALAASPIGHLDKSEPPFLLMHGAADKIVSPVQSKKMYEALKAQGMSSDYVLVKGAAKAPGADARL